MNETHAPQPETRPEPQAITRKQKLRAWLELARISNLPTVWSNVLVGVAIAVVADLKYATDMWDRTPAGIASDPSRMLGIVLLPMIAISFYYIAGMMLNDVVDLPIDRKERPNRPLPSGRVSLRAAVVCIVALFIVGWLLIYFWSTRQVDWPVFSKPSVVLWNTALIAAIVAYDFWHKKFAASIVLMGVSRSMVYIVAACSVGWSIVSFHVAWWLAIILGLYTIVITVVARGETEDRIDSRKWLAIVMPIGVLAMVAVVRPVNMLWPAIAGLALCFWLSPTFRYVFTKPPKTVKAILTWLSGMCLVDAYFLTLLGQPILALVAGVCFLLAAWGHRHILGT